MIREVLRMGNPQLLQRSRARTELRHAGARRAAAGSCGTRWPRKNGAGLAAPQIGVLQQVVIFGVEHNERYPDAEPVPYTELVNPVLTPLSEAIDEDWEGCLSVPGLRGIVPRYAHLRYEGFDPLGQPIRREVSGFHARVVQHECDHLMGILYPMRMRDLSRFGYTDIIFPDSAPDEE